MTTPPLAWRHTLVALALVLSAAVTIAPGAQAQPVVSIAGVEAIGMTVADLERSAEFFARVLSFERVASYEAAGGAFDDLDDLRGTRARVARMRLGDESIELRQFVTPRGRPAPDGSRSNDHWFQHIAIVVSDMDRAYRWLGQNAVVPVSQGPQRLPDWNANAAGIRAFYFLSPDGDRLELIEIPPGKGQEKWHEKTARLFLGIDHTAIVVADSDRSLVFYRDVLGLDVVGGSENYGIEQERLNDVAGAHLRITALRAPRGPGIELLEYLEPAGGRPIPADQHANDLAYWQVDLRTSVLRAIPSVVRARARGKLVFDLAAPQDLGLEAAVVLRDPDGHAVRLVQ